jgi:hypothetical protein
VVASGTSTNGVTLTYDEYGVIRLSGKNESTSTINFNLTDSIGKYIKLKAGTYKYSQNAGYDLCKMRIAVRSAGNVFIKNITIYDNTSSKFTIPQEDEESGYQYGFNITVVENADVNGVVLNPMLNEGETALPYEPYFEGLKNASFAGIESTGRNLINQDLLLEGTGASRAVFEGFDCIKLTQGITVIPFECKANTNVRLSLDAAWENGVDTYWFFQYADGTISSKSLFSVASSEGRGFTNRSSQPIVVPEKDVVGISVRRYNSKNILYLKDFMLNNGTTALPYEPYTEPSVLNFPKTELGEWDSIDFEKQKVVRGMQTVVFDGTESWTLQSMNSHGIYNYQVYAKGTTSDKGICNLYNIQYTTIGNTTNEGFMLTAGGGGILFIRTKSYTTVADWKAHLAELYASGNPLTVAYKLATPTETPFTDEEKASGDEYQARVYGTERVLGNDNEEYGVKNTLSQNYIIVTGGK